MASAPVTPAQLFAQGVHAALSRWEVLQAAIDGSWGGRDTEAKAEWLEETLIDMFAKGKSVIMVMVVMMIVWMDSYSCGIE